MYKFSLRFYNQTDDKVEECVAKLKQNSKAILGHTYENNGRSMNFGMVPSHTVMLKFINERTAEQTMMSNQTMRDIYMQYANGTGLPGTFEERQPTNPVWQH
jgi:hypothetical protein